MEKKKILDFEVLIDTIRRIADPKHQKEIWVERRNPKSIDSYDETTIYFLEDASSVIDATKEGRVEMDAKQLDVLEKLYQMVGEYDSSIGRPDEDLAIIQDPRWIEVSEFAKTVYKTLCGETSDLTHISDNETF